MSRCPWTAGTRRGSYLCIKAFSETDQAEDLKKLDVPTLRDRPLNMAFVIQGDDDQIVPFAKRQPAQSKLVKGATLKVYKGAPHVLCTTHKGQGAIARSSCRTPWRRGPR